MRSVIYLAVAAVVTLLSGCDPFEKQRAEQAEKTRIECLDKICPGDVVPTRDHMKEVVFKKNGKWFLMPKQFGDPNFGAIAFYWPSKTPKTGRPDGKDYPERGKAFDQTAIEIFIRSINEGYETTRQTLEKAEVSGKVTNRVMVKPGLERVNIQSDHRAFYVATKLTGLDGKPPVMACAHDYPSHDGGTSFVWKPGISVGAGGNQKHCTDWPEIYPEIINVLNQIKETQP